MDNSYDTSSETGYSILVVVPSIITCNTSEKCIAIFNAPLPRHISFVVKFTSSNKTSFVKSERVNDTSMTFQTPNNFPPGKTSISIHNKNNQNLLCKYKSDFVFESNLEKVHELLKSVSDPVSFMGDALGVTETNDAIALDFTLEKIFKTNKPANFYLLKDKKSGIVAFSLEKHTSRNPTLLHFAARYNLVRLCLELVDSPGGREALNLQNLDGLYPHNLAEQCVNASLAKILLEAKEEDTTSTTRQRDSNCADEIYEHMSNELFQHYKQVKKVFVFSNNNNTINSSKEQSFDEDSTDGGDLYDVCPPPRPASASHQQQHQKQQLTRADTTRNDVDDDEDNYEDMEASLSAPGSNENSFKARSLLGFPEMSTRSVSVPDIARGLFNGADGGLGKVANPLLEELRRRNDMKRGSVPAISLLPPVNRPLSGGAGGGEGRPTIKSAGSSFESDHSSSTSITSTITSHNDEIYATPTPRPNSLSLPIDTLDNNQAAVNSGPDDTIYDIPPPRNKTVLPSPMNSKSAPPPQQQQQQPGMELYDSLRSTENDLYVPASRYLEREKDEEEEEKDAVDETYDVPPPRNQQHDADFPLPPPPPRVMVLPTDLSSLHEMEEAVGFETYDTPTPRMTGLRDPNLDNSDIVDDTYDVPVKLSASVEELSRPSPSPSVNAMTRSPHKPYRNFEFGRTGKRNSEPVIPTFTPADKQWALQRQQAVIHRNQVPTIPPRSANSSQQNQRSPKLTRRPLIPPPLPPQRQTKR